MRTLKEYKHLQQMNRLVGKKVKFITSYMNGGEYNIMTLDKIETDGFEFDEPYFSTKDNGTFCTLEYATSNMLNDN
tara:strand:+ start:886 stop:1113 length:228 start_codon:yes stop_codon:yes gene_type:complete